MDNKVQPLPVGDIPDSMPGYLPSTGDGQPSIVLAEMDNTLPAMPEGQPGISLVDPMQYTEPGDENMTPPPGIPVGRVI